MKELISEQKPEFHHPTVRVRFHPKDTGEIYDGTVIEETRHSYLVIPDNNLSGNARWNKKRCKALVEILN